MTLACDLTITVPSFTFLSECLAWLVLIWLQLLMVASILDKLKACHFMYVYTSLAMEGVYIYLSESWVNGAPMALKTRANERHLIIIQNS